MRRADAEGTVESKLTGGTTMAAEDQRDTPEAFIRGIEAGVEKKFTA